MGKRKQIHKKYLEGYLLERAFIETTLELFMERRIKKYSDQARLIWGDVCVDIYSKWRDLRGTKQIEPQTLTIRDAVLIADTFGKTLPEMLYLASLKLKQGWLPDNLPGPWSKDS